MEMQQIRYFLALAETLNFTRAAEQCNVSQPALTRAIQGLEAELGGPLVHRERNKTHLSELGRIMTPYFESIRAQTDAARATAQEFSAMDRARLTIGAMCTIGPTLVSEFIMSFQMSNENVELEVRDAGVKLLIDDLIEGRLEVALLGQPEGVDVRFHGLPLFDERFVLVVPPEHRLAKLNAVPVRELHGEPYVNRANCEYYDFVHEQFVNMGVRTRKVFSSERDDWVQGMIKAGMGIGYFPENSVTDPQLAVRPLVDPEFARTIMLVTVRGRPHSPAVGSFVRQAKSFRWPGAARSEPPRPALEGT
ncbi:MAG: LysR family transcriptional regulator [Amphiplicatus sp.]